MVKLGVHINAVGTFSPTTREVASDLIGAARLYSDHTPSCRKESGEYLIPLKEGIITESHIIGSVGELLLGKVPGRQSKNDITVFDALGLAVDLSGIEEINNIRGCRIHGQKIIDAAAFFAILTSYLNIL